MKLGRTLATTVVALAIPLSALCQQAKSDLDIVTELMAKKSPEAVEKVEALIRAKDLDAESRGKALVLQGRLRERQKRAEEALASYQEAVQIGKGEGAGEAAYRLATIYDGKKETKDIRRELLRKVADGELQANAKFRGFCTYAYAMAKMKNQHEREDAKRLLLSIDAGAVPAEKETVNRARYTLGHVYSATFDFEKAYWSFSRADLTGFPEDERADLELQRAWTYMERCRQLTYAKQTDPEFTWEKSRELSNSVGTLFDKPGAMKGSLRATRIADLMALETYYYSEQYDKVPTLVDLFVAKYAEKAPKSREEAMARFWKAAAYQRQKKYEDCLLALSELEAQNYPGKTLNGFMNNSAYIRLFYADCFHGLARHTDAARELEVLRTKYPEFYKNRKDKLERFPSLALVQNADN